VAFAAVAYAFFSSMQMNHHNFALTPPDWLDGRALALT
jgi:hypothetical protein